MAKGAPPTPVQDVLGLETLDQATAPTFAELLEKLYAANFQGNVTLHFAGGVPRSITLVESTSVPLAP